MGERHREPNSFLFDMCKRFLAQRLRSSAIRLAPCVGGALVTVALAACGVTGGASANPARPTAGRPGSESVTGVSGEGVSTSIEARGALEGLAQRMRPPREAARADHRFREIEYHTIVTNAGAPLGYTLFRTLIRNVVVMPTSAAVIGETADGRARFATRVDEANWRASGSPQLPASRGAIRYALPDGEFSFTPQGAALTFQDVLRLVPRPEAIESTLAAALKRQPTTMPPASLLLRQYGFLLGAAPLNRTLRVAVIEAMAALPGLYACGPARDLVGRRGYGVCVQGQMTGIQVILDPRSGVGLATNERLEEPTPLFPHLTVGTLIESDTFIQQ